MNTSNPCNVGYALWNSHRQRLGYRVREVYSQSCAFTNKNTSSPGVRRSRKFCSEILPKQLDQNIPWIGCFFLNAIDEDIQECVDEVDEKMEMI